MVDLVIKGRSWSSSDQALDVTSSSVCNVWVGTIMNRIPNQILKIVNVYLAEKQKIRSLVGSVR